MLWVALTQFLILCNPKAIEAVKNCSMMLFVHVSGADIGPPRSICTFYRTNISD